MEDQFKTSEDWQNTLFQYNSWRPVMTSNSVWKNVAKKSWIMTSRWNFRTGQNHLQIFPSPFTRELQAARWMDCSSNTSAGYNYQNAFRNLICNVKRSNCLSIRFGNLVFAWKWKKNTQNIQVVVFSWRNEGNWLLVNVTRPLTINWRSPVWINRG